MSNQQNGYGYDATGNLTSAEGRTYEYDVQNHLTHVYAGQRISASHMMATASFAAMCGPARGSITSLPITGST
ncbi:MAG: RHS repeat protein [Chloroflexi bacterium]|nr:RHS repeat protein [Chloroflexota bacterium]